ncbi:MAG: hypothetical protein WKF37_11030 [Bryobacteraceae bacterium]
MLFALIVQLLHRVRKFLLAAGVLLAGFQVVLILQANAIQASNSFAKMGDLVPSFARDVLGPSFVMFLTFKGIVCLGYFHPIVMGALVSVSVTLATIPVMEIETGFIDLVLARPVARHWIVTRSILVAVISTVYLLAMMAFGTWIGLSKFAAKDAAWPSAGLVCSLAINLGFLMLCWAAIAMAVGCACRRRVRLEPSRLAARRLTSPTTSAGRETGGLGGVASPFRYYTPFELVMGSALSAKSLYVLGGIAAAFALAYLLYSRRDIAH